MGERWHFHDLGKISGIPVFLDQNKNILEKKAKIAKVVQWPKKVGIWPPLPKIAPGQKLVRAEGVWDCKGLFIF